MLSLGIVVAVQTGEIDGLNSEVSELNEKVSSLYDDLDNADQVLETTISDYELAISAMKAAQENVLSNTEDNQGLTQFWMDRHEEKFE